jgi:hypothetical protein
VKNVPVHVQLLYFDGCPHWMVMEERLRQALDLLDLPAAIEHRLVETQEEAEHLQFRGSPSMLLNGTDPFGSPSTPIGLTCRVYPTPHGPAGSPTLDQLVGALDAGIAG